MNARWLWAVGVLLCAQLLPPRVELPARSPLGRELKRVLVPRPLPPPRIARQE